MEKTINKRLQNQKIIDTLTIKCPGEDFMERETIAYRWVFDDLEDEKNFMPQFLKQPKRFNNKPPKMICQSLGLSLYKKEKQARKKFLFLQKQLTDKAYKKLGTKLAVGKLELPLGLMNNASKDGHFTHYPYENVDLKIYFQMNGDL